MRLEQPTGDTKAPQTVETGQGSRVSVIQDPKLEYPDPADYFSPSEAFPEYTSKPVSGKPNAVYAAVRQCLAQAGLDRENFGKPGWNPLGEFIKPGQKVFVLCNFVQHNFTKDPRNTLAKCTHGSVVRAVIDYVLIALQGRGSVAFGNAPLQSCIWEQVISETGARRVEEFYANVSKSGVPVKLTDLRQQVTRRGAFGTMETSFRGEERDFIVPVDLGAGSLLNEFFHDHNDPHLRVLDYDHRRTESCHSRDRHVYLVSKEVMESDVVVSVPKLKTHEKVGITCGIKGCVGSVAQKDCLAHHRLGSPRAGGDEYPNSLAPLKMFSALHDRANLAKPGTRSSILHSLDFYSRKVIRRFTRALGGSWPGNDTCWRMALDLAWIVEHADKHGRLWPEKQRRHILFTDGIVAGEGNGPLSPKPVALGYVNFADNVAWGDRVNCLAMGFDPEKLPMLRESFARLGGGPASPVSVCKNGQETKLESLRGGPGKKFSPPREWRGYL
jgi:uncharacterized protein (DUF362 family)